MSDFLSNLVSRTMTPARTIQPRFAPMFGSPYSPVAEATFLRSPSDLPSDEPPWQEMEMEVPARTPAPSPAPEPELRMKTAKGENRGAGFDALQNLARPTTAAPQSILTPARNRTAAQDLTDAASSRSASQQPTSPEERQANEEHLPAHTFSDTLRDHARSAAAKPAALAALASVNTRTATLESFSEVTASPNQPLPTVTAGQRGDAIAVMPVQAPTTNPFETARTPAAKASFEPLVMPSFLDRTSPAVTEDVSAPVSQPAPTIRVNIGRIEVRAVIPPEPVARKRTPPSPRLSLEDYLKQRQGGRR